MPVFKEMDQDEVLKLLAGHRNVIKEEMTKVDEYFSKLECPYCRGSCRPVVNSKKLFETNSILPNFIAECNDCEAQFSPETKITIRIPKTNPLEP